MLWESNCLSHTSLPSLSPVTAPRQDSLRPLGLWWPSAQVPRLSGDTASNTDTAWYGEATGHASNRRKENTSG